MNSIKAFWMSKTLWFNLCLAIVSAVPTVQAYIMAHPMLAGEISAVANFLLRLVTVNGVGMPQ